MVGGVAVAFGTLYARAALALADIANLRTALVISVRFLKMCVAGTYQFPSSSRYQLDSIDRLHVHCVADAGFVDPDCTQKMRPLSISSLFEGAVFVWTQYAGLWESSWCFSDSKVSVLRSSLPQAGRARLCIYDIAIGLLGYMGRRSSL